MGEKARSLEVATQLHVSGCLHLQLDHLRQCSGNKDVKASLGEGKGDVTLTTGVLEQLCKLYNTTVRGPKTEKLAALVKKREEAQQQRDSTAEAL